MLRFPDNTKVAVDGLDDIMADLYAENRRANGETAEVIIQKLIEKKNYIPSSVNAQREYALVLLEVYRKFIKSRSGSEENSYGQNL